MMRGLAAACQHYVLCLSTASSNPAKSGDGHVLPMTDR
jgi:hypothetical protein